MSTDVVVRRTLDLTRAPDEQWNAEMVELVARNVFRGKEITLPQLHYCLAVADGIGLNPLIQEIYFLPGKSKDAGGPAWTPYIGRNGLVAKATEHGYYYEAETVRENDKFRMNRRRDGTVEVTHSYGSADRGKIVGAYAFLHDVDAKRRPAFFYARWDEYAPVFDQDWKFEKSPWGNQESAMMEKCAMIGAGRKRLNLGHVLSDGEIPRVQQMQEMGPASLPSAGEGAQPFDFAELAADAKLRERLALASAAAKWSPAKCELVMAGRSTEELEAIADRLEAEVDAARASEPAEEVVDGEHAPGPESPPAAASEAESVQDAVVVDADRVAGLEKRKATIEDALNEPVLEEREASELVAELEQVESELEAVRNPDQGSLL
jgi:hypothetical protein